MLLGIKQFFKKEAVPNAIFIFKPVMCKNQIMSTQCSKYSSWFLFLNFQVDFFIDLPTHTVLTVYNALRPCPVLKYNALGYERETEKGDYRLYRLLSCFKTRNDTCIFRNQLRTQNSTGNPRCNQGNNYRFSWSPTQKRVAKKKKKKAIVCLLWELSWGHSGCT